jgi:hypothetical protein
MSFIWSRKVRQQLQQTPQKESEDIQTVNLPTYDKISDIEHKNGKRLVSTRQKDDENNEIEGNLQKR